MASDGVEGYPSREDRIVAEFGDGLDVEGIAFRYGLTVAQVYAVIEREVGTADPGFPSQYPPPVHYGPPPPNANYYAPPTGPPAYQMPPPPYAPPGYPGPGQGFPPWQGVPDEDAIVAEYGEGHDVDWIARKHGINIEQVYEVVLRNVDDDDPQPPGR